MIPRSIIHLTLLSFFFFLFTSIATGEQISSGEAPFIVPLRQTLANLPNKIWEKLKSIVGIKNYYGVTLPHDQIEGTAAKTPRPANCPPDMPCAQCRLLNSAKDWVRKKYKNRPRSHGDCGGAVGDMILNAGFPFIKRPNKGTKKGQDPFNRYAIDYMNFLPQLGWTDLKITDPKQAPPGAILVYSGPCTTTAHGQGQPAEKWGCNGAPGNRVGHATIQSDEPSKRSSSGMWTYTDGRTEQPAVNNRYFVTAFVPGPELNALCEEPQ